MPVTKRSFPCGHRGHGKFCHRCSDAERLAKKHAFRPGEGFDRQAMLLKMTDQEVAALRAKEKAEQDATEAAAREQERRLIARMEREDIVLMKLRDENFDGNDPRFYRSR